MNVFLLMCLCCRVRHQHKGASPTQIPFNSIMLPHDAFISSPILGVFIDPGNNCKLFKIIQQGFSEVNEIFSARIKVYCLAELPLYIVDFTVNFTMVAISRPIY